MVNHSTVPTRGSLLLVLIVGASIAIAIASYLYSSYNSDFLKQNEVKKIDQAARIQANDIDKIVENKISDIRNNLILISKTTPVQLQNVRAAAPAFAIGQESTSDFTDSYFWLDKDGKILWANSFSDDAIYQRYSGADRSDRSYYADPKEAHAFHISAVTESVDGVPRIFFSYPVLSDEEGDADRFKGVIIASANPTFVGQYLKSQLSQESSNSIGLMTKDAVILYSDDEKLIGDDYYGNEFQSQLPEGLKEDFNSVIDNSLKSSGLRQETLSYEGNSGSITSIPITIDGASFGILYIVAPYTVANEAQQIVDSQTTFTIVLIGALAGVALAAALAVLRWNKSLRREVTNRTAELQDSNRSLSDALEELKVHDKMQKEFINIAAHELRTPVQPILSMSEITQMDNSSDAGLADEVKMPKEDFEMIVRNARRLERLSSDILEVARIESNSLKIQTEIFDLNIKINAVIHDIKPMATGEKNMDIVFEPASHPILVNADKTKTFEVISNLIGNAIKFTPSDGKIIIETKEQDDEVIISVTDTGPGIDPEIVPKLFTKFATKSFTGTGLGLYISKAIVEAQGGRIWAVNNSNGKGGATFSFSLRLAKQESLTEISARETKVI